MQVIERYEQSCPMNSTNVKNNCYLSNELSKPEFCENNFTRDINTGQCISNQPSDISNFIESTDNTCPTNSTGIYKDKTLLCVPNKFVNQAQCGTTLKQIDTNVCWNGKNEPTSFGCAKGDKVDKDNECITTPITLCPINPLTGAPLIYDAKNGYCK
jgi:hypothetical protein